MTIPKNILVVRNDKIGDFALSFQALAILKTSIPDSTITVLVPKYTAELATACEWIDNILIDPGSDTSLFQILSFYKTLRSLHFDAAITLFSTTRIGVGLFFADIPYRLAPATKLAQIFYNHRCKQHRSQSLKPEYEYNSDIIRYFLNAFQISINETITAPYLRFEQKKVRVLHESFCQTNHIPTSAKLIFVHPGSGGSATNLSIQQYAELIKKLRIPNNYIVVLTAGPNEDILIHQLANMLGSIPHRKYISNKGLIIFAEHIQFCNLFISSSTGPLHIAGALNRPTAGFYTRRRSATPLRWQTLNTPDRRLAFTPPVTADETDMSQIDINKAAREINDKFLQD